ncbi:MAG: hypothetical protein DRJ51_05055 [Thermoprotei archaeon]|nr:MAG: hypothetical protein DRJ51_05055 [Thermoprotei archaeon]RLF00321.1 MAG: hypothetical protein DRJ59_07300 [Thermoprotei archaeon]
MNSKGVRLARFMYEGIDEIFYCWIRRRGGEDFDEEFVLDRASRYWLFDYREKRYTVFTKAMYVKPKEVITVSLRSKDTFPYGVFDLMVKLPSWPKGPTVWFGFEIEDLFGGGVIHYRFVPGTPGSLAACAGAFPEPICVELPSFPQDYAERRHTYSIHVYRSMAMWLIDGKVRGIVLYPEHNIGKHVVTNKPPYAIALAPVRPSTHLSILLDIDGCPEEEYVWEDLHPWNLRVLPGDPEPKFALKLYKHGSDEMLAGSTVEREIVSHPVPIYDLRNKTILFKASAPGVLRLEVCTLSGTWEEYKTIQVDEDELLKELIEHEALLARMIYRPSKGPAHIKVAEFLGT